MNRGTPRGGTRGTGGYLLSKKVLKVMKYLLYLVSLTFLLFMILFGEQGWWDLKKIEKEQVKTIQRIEQFEKRRVELEEMIDRLKKDDSYIERVIREEYGWIREGEMIYLFKEGGSESKDTVEAKESDEDEDPS